MKTILIRAGIALLGMVITLAWWTYHGTGSKTQSSDHIPAKIGVGGNKLEVFADASTPSTMRISFSDDTKPVGSQILLESWEKIPAGTRAWSIDVPTGVGGYIELGADAPKPGDTLGVQIKVNGVQVNQQKDRLESPLQPNTAFFVQYEADDYSKASSSPNNAAEEE